ncbi:hypothetical protein PHSY_002864 [Pseudozyma hubeiensis SY62]|uniref:Uncharacterized protein n=1 Tax=Pseudozyma hubeiensis (strain SY62) TaxID=1305764 RepID=R9P230_PSEHS|nr:hypothetical protein PHSY_002864 [Pseudozyma hubeiensis SY62]GAC95289.1 hypothetical protein PHSY_002864 [Pseudozyma hubeiensis SY62]
MGMRKVEGVDGWLGRRSELVHDALLENERRMLHDLSGAGLSFAVGLARYARRRLDLYGSQRIDVLTSSAVPGLCSGGGGSARRRNECDVRHVPELSEVDRPKLDGASDVCFCSYSTKRSPTAGGSMQCLLSLCKEKGIAELCPGSTATNRREELHRIEDGPEQETAATPWPHLRSAAATIIATTNDAPGQRGLAVDAATDTRPAARGALLLIAASADSFVMLGLLRLPSFASFLRRDLLGMASRRDGTGNAEDSKKEKSQRLVFVFASRAKQSQMVAEAPLEN